VRSLAILLLPAVLLAVDLRPVTIAPEGAALPTEARRNGVPETPRPFQPLIGTIDTVGGTSYDWWFGGPSWRQIAGAPAYGLHVCWMHSQEVASTTFADRNVRYNFYDFSTHRWNWIDSADYMQSGINTFPQRSGYGNISFDPTTGCAVVGRHCTQTGTMHVECARDIVPGVGLFEYADGGGLTDSYQWPFFGVDSAGTIHAFTEMATYGMGYFRVANWPSFEPVVHGFEPPTTFPSHNIAVTPFGRRACCCWTDNVDPISLAYYRVSNDGGTTWEQSQELVVPQAFGGDTLTSYHIASMNPFYDRQNRLHFSVVFMPVHGDTGYIIPSDLWHWCEGTWSRIARAGCDPAHLAASIGYNATYACRPNLGSDEHGNLYVTWEQFDSMNVEPTTELLRADIFCSASRDNGVTWTVPERLTDAGTHSCRFPTITEVIGRGRDTLDIMYLLDQTAGFWVQNQHPGEINPVIVQHVPIVPGIEERSSVPPCRIELAVFPSNVRSGASVSYAVPRAGEVALVLHDATGRVVQALAHGHREAGRYSERLSGASLPAGVYFCTLESGGRTTSAKLTVTR
jgi:hypothetical protein